MPGWLRWWKLSSSTSLVLIFWEEKQFISHGRQQHQFAGSFSRPHGKSQASRGSQFGAEIHIPKIHPGCVNTRELGCKDKSWQNNKFQNKGCTAVEIPTSSRYGPAGDIQMGTFQGRKAPFSEERAEFHHNLPIFLFTALNYNRNVLNFPVSFPLSSSNVLRWPEGFSILFQKSKDKDSVLQPAWI